MVVRLATEGRRGTGEGGRRPGSVCREQQGLITGCVLVFGLVLFDGLKEHQLHFNVDFSGIRIPEPLLFVLLPTLSTACKNG